MQPNIEGGDSHEIAKPVSSEQVVPPQTDTPQEAFELALAEDPTPAHIKRAEAAMDDEGKVVVGGVRMPYSEAVEMLKREAEGEGKTTNEGTESTPEPSSEQPPTGTNSEGQAEQFRSAMQSLRETYEQQSDAVSNAIKRFDEAKQQYGPDDPRTLSAKNQWGFADRARAETGEAIAGYIQQYPEIADVFEVGASEGEKSEGVGEEVVETAQVPVTETAEPLQEIRTEVSDSVEALAEPPEIVETSTEPPTGTPSEASGNVGVGVEQIEDPGIEDVYGLDEESLSRLLDSRGYGEILDANDPDFKNKYKEFEERQKAYGQARVKLFDRVLSGEATSREVKMAEDHASKIAGIYGLAGFHSAVPKSWYSNERLRNALASSSEENKKWVEYASKNYTDEELKNGGFEEVGEDGYTHTYRRKIEN